MKRLERIEIVTRLREKSLKLYGVKNRWQRYLTGPVTHVQVEMILDKLMEIKFNG